MLSKVKFKKIFKYLWIVYAVASIVFVVILIDRLICKDIMNVSNRYILNEGWNVKINDEYYENIDIENFSFASVNKNNVVVMEKVIPDYNKYEQPVLVIFSRHSAMSVYVDGDLKYEYGHERHMQNKATGCGYHFINFFEEYKGKTLKIEYIATEKQAFSKFDVLWISEWKNAYRYIITENRLPLMVGIFLMVLGVIMTCVLVFSIMFSTKYSSVLLLALFSICIGIWTICYYNVILIFSIPIYSISLMQYMSLFIAPLPLIAYMGAYVKEINNKHVSFLHKALFFVQLAMTVAAILLHSFDIVHGAEVLKYFHVIFVIHMLFFVYIISCHMKKSTTMSKASTVGMLIVAFCLFYELLKYIVPRYTGYKLLEIKGIAPMGFVVFIGILVIDLYMEITKNMMEKHEKELLIKLAYTDELTKLYNRTYCSECLQMLSENEKDSYTIINFDLNGLKKMNDTYGHAKGDELICAAAKVIDKSFSADGVVGRMGGDEFIAIMGMADIKYIDQLIDKFISNIEYENKENPELGLSISYGYATSSELEGAGHEKVYQLADERMYAYKQKVKKAAENSKLK